MMSLQDSALHLFGGFMVTGGVIAQHSPDPTVGNAGILIGVTGLLTASYPWLIKIIEALQKDQKIVELESRMVAYKSETEKRIAEVLGGTNKDLQGLREVYDARVADLESRLSKADQDAAEAVGWRHQQMSDVITEIGALKLILERKGVAVDATEKAPA